MNLGCSLVGPSGTGKGETVKNLAKMIRRHSITIGCSSEVAENELVKYLRGACSGGSWLIVD